MDRVPSSIGAGVVILRDPMPGDLGQIISSQARLYAAEYGWDQTFEALLAELIARFVREFQPGYERCWVADRAGQVVGSAFVVRHADEGTAQLRMLYVDPTARGIGLGAQLVDATIAFARRAGYRRMVLWTHDILVSARRIYVSRGFQLDAEERHHSFGHDLVGQFWSRGL